MTYLSFLLIFLIPLLLLFSIVSFFRMRVNRHDTIGILILVIIAVLYTTPWDSHIINNGIWFYDNDKIIGTLFNIPFEEYLFMIIQTIISGLIFCNFKKKVHGVGFKFSIKYLLLFLLIFFVGLFLLKNKSSVYIGYLIAWAAIPLAIQLSVGSKVIYFSFKNWILPLLIFTTYLSIIDSIAIGNNIWTINDVTSCGFKIFSLPVEEIIFFLLTNLLIFQGMSLWSILEKND